MALRPIRDLRPADAPAATSMVAAARARTAAQEVTTARVAPVGAGVRLRAVVDRDYDFLWRTLRYQGVPDESLDDAAQQALCIFARRIHDVTPGAERAFLFSTAMHVASEMRRAQRRRPASPVDSFDAFVAEGPSAEELVDARRAHDVLRVILETLPDELRAVFVLFEVEEMTVAEIAAVIGVPAGTAASRLRRARELFQEAVRRYKAARAHAERVRT